MKRNLNISSLDPNQMMHRTFDEHQDAQRVILVGGENLTLNADMQQQNTQEVRVIEIEKPIIIKEKEIVYVDKIQVVVEKQIEYVERPIIVKEQIFVEKPVIVYERQIEYVDRPVIIEKAKEIQIEYVDRPVQSQENKLYQKMLFILLGLHILVTVMSIIRSH